MLGNGSYAINVEQKLSMALDTLTVLTSISTLSFGTVSVNTSCRRNGQGISDGTDHSMPPLYTNHIRYDC